MTLPMVIVASSAIICVTVFITVEKPNFSIRSLRSLAFYNFHEPPNKVGH